MPARAKGKADDEPLIAVLRERIGVARVENAEICIRPVRAALAELQARVRKHLVNSGESVDRFLADRRHSKPDRVIAGWWLTGRRTHAVGLSDIPEEQSLPLMGDRAAPRRVAADR